MARGEWPGEADEEGARPAGMCHNSDMETYTIRPRGGTYRIEATDETGGRRLVGTYPTEQAAVALLKRLQEKAGLADPELRRAKDWRL